MTDRHEDTVRNRGIVVGRVYEFLEENPGEWWKTPELSEKLFKDYFEPDYKNEKSFRRVLSEVKSIFEKDSSIAIVQAHSSGSIPTHKWTFLPECDHCGEIMELADEHEGKDFDFLCKNKGCEGVK